MKQNKQQLFTAAHALTRETLSKYGKADYHATFSLALKAIYNTIKTEEKTMENKTMTATEEFISMTETEQVNALTAMVWHEVKVHKAESDKSGNEKPNYFDWIKTEEHAQQMVNEMYCLIFDILEVNDSENGEHLPLALVMHKAAHKATAAIKKAERRHINGFKSRSKRIKAENGESVTLLEEYIQNAPKTDKIAENPEKAAIFSEMIEAAAHDSTDKRILEMLQLEISTTAIAAALNVTKSAISQRVTAMAKRILAYNKEADIDGIYSALDRILYR